MTVIGFHNSHEQVHPADLLRAVQHAEQVGFTAAMCSDHLEPWNERQGHSGFAWSWLGAALQATRLPFGVVNAPGQRYHPAIIAQAISTLTEMYPGRFWTALGTGELRIKKGGPEQSLLISGGFVEVRPDIGWRLTIPICIPFVYMPFLSSLTSLACRLRVISPSICWYLR